jgi:hypothetical protein
VLSYGRTPALGDAMDLAHHFEDHLEAWAQELIRTNRRLSRDRRVAFGENADTVGEHQPRWHQWGILTHTRQFLLMYDGEAQELLESWGLEAAVARVLSEEIDGIPKRELLRASIPLHDLGKFRKADKGTRHPPHGQPPSGDFNAHAGISQRLVEKGVVDLGALGLTDAQVAYVARCAGNHYELGFVRGAAKTSAMDYSLAFVASDAFTAAVVARSHLFRGFEVEVGLLYLGDSLAKTDIIIQGATDAALQAQAQELARRVAKAGHDAALVKAVLQRPVNIAAARRYLLGVLG